MTTTQKAMRLIKRMDCIKLKPRLMLGLSFSDAKTGKHGTTKTVHLSFVTTLLRAVIWMLSLGALMKSASLLSKMKKTRACKKKLCQKYKAIRARSKRKKTPLFGMKF